MRLRRTRTLQIPRFGVQMPPAPHMVEVTESEALTVLAWRIRELEERLDEVEGKYRVTYASESDQIHADRVRRTGDPLAGVPG